MKICLIGYGYWGKILFKNLQSLGSFEITIVDEIFNNIHLINDSFDCYFIATPFKTHSFFLKKIALFKNKKIWCEKPLVESYKDTLKMYSLIKKNNNKLFVDWVYTFNPCILYLKKILKNKKLKQIILNRTNFGPIRTDCSSIYDLSTHDLSILYFLFENIKLNFKFNEFSLTKKKNIGSNLSWCYTDNIQILINSSWEHKIKNRTNLFLTETNEIIIFDDVEKIVINNNSIKKFTHKKTPIENALNFFLKTNDFKENQKLTVKITKSVDSNYEHKI